MAVDDAYEISDYLPISFNTPSEQEYIAFLWEAFEVNYANGKHQFAFLACHMLMMSFVYSKLWQIKKFLYDDFRKSLIALDQQTERRIDALKSPFDFTAAPERSAMRFLRLIGCDYSEVSKYQELVDERNNVAHANGTISFNSPEAIDRKVAQIVRVMDEIQVHSTRLIEQSYHEFLVESSTVGRLYSAERNARIKDVLVSPNYFSAKDLEICGRFDISGLSNQKSFSYIRSLHKSLGILLREQYPLTL